MKAVSRFSSAEVVSTAINIETEKIKPIHTIGCEWTASPR
jgi:hypothetical protein